MSVKLLTEHHLESEFKGRLYRLILVYTCQNATLLEISSRGSFVAALTVCGCCVGSIFCDVFLGVLSSLAFV